jgi:hypothetical protein
LASFRLGDVNMEEEFVDQDARHVRTKFSKTFRTYLMPVSDLAMSVARDWHAEMSADLSRGPQDPLFPATDMGLSADSTFAPQGLAREAWATGSPIREIFKAASTSAGLPYFNPHSIRDMLVRHIMILDLPVERPRQAELIKRGLRQREAQGDDPLNADVIAEVMRRLQGPQPGV